MLLAIQYPCGLKAATVVQSNNSNGGFACLPAQQPAPATSLNFITPFYCIVEQADAYDAYANRDFQAAVQYLTDILQADASNPRWLEMRAQVGTNDTC
jgi:hypothetical protein